MIIKSIKNDQFWIRPIFDFFFLKNRRNQFPFFRLNYVKKKSTTLTNFKRIYSIWPVKREISFHFGCGSRYNDILGQCCWKFASLREIVVANFSQSLICYVIRSCGVGEGLDEIIYEKTRQAGRWKIVKFHANRSFSREIGRQHTKLNRDSTLDAADKRETSFYDKFIKETNAYTYYKGNARFIKLSISHPIYE